MTASGTVIATSAGEEEQLLFRDEGSAIAWAELGELVGPSTSGDEIRLQGLSLVGDDPKSVLLAWHGFRTICFKHCTVSPGGFADLIHACRVLIERQDGRGHPRSLQLGVCVAGEADGLHESALADELYRLLVELARLAATEHGVLVTVNAELLKSQLSTETKIYAEFLTDWNCITSSTWPSDQDQDLNPDKRVRIAEHKKTYKRPAGWLSAVDNPFLASLIYDVHKHCFLGWRALRGHSDIPEGVRDKIRSVLPVMLRLWSVVIKELGKGREIKVSRGSVGATSSTRVACAH